MVAPGSGGSRAYGVLAQSSQNNAIVVSGYSDFASSVLTLARLTNGAQLDTTYGGSGTGFALNSSMKEPNWAIPPGTVLHPNGDLLTAGTATTSQLAVAAYLPDGTPDTTFGTGGITTANFPGVSNGVGIAIQPSDGKIVVAGNNGIGNSTLVLARFLPPDPKVGSFTASPNPVPAGNGVTLTASNILDSNPTSTITQVALYVDSNGDGVLEPGTDTLIGYATQASPGIWSLTFIPSTLHLTTGRYTLFAQAEDDLGVLSDPFALALQVQ
jgi:hypothetical protein